MELEKISDVQSIIRIFFLLLLDLTSFRCHLTKLKMWDGHGMVQDFYASQIFKISGLTLELSDSDIVPSIMPYSKKGQN